jgi:hypothetical protein
MIEQGLTTFIFLYLHLLPTVIIIIIICCDNIQNVQM